MLSNIRYKYIAIEGNIGVGKTTLAKKLSAKIEAQLILEKFRKNHFLPLFYNDMDKYGLHVELSFLVDRYEDHSFILHSKERIISDYFFSKTLLFAKVNLDKHAYKIFERVYINFERKALKPDLILYLKRDINHLLKNIKNRKRENEQQIKASYLAEVQKSYNDYFSKASKFRIIELDISNANLKQNSIVDNIIELLGKKYPYGITSIRL
jgi:deoxyguanosine kinase